MSAKGLESYGEALCSQNTNQTKPHVIVSVFVPLI